MKIVVFESCIHLHMYVFELIVAFVEVDTFLRLPYGDIPFLYESRHSSGVVFTDCSFDLVLSVEPKKFSSHSYMIFDAVHI